MTAKQLYLHAVAQHRLGKVAQGEKNFGIAVSRMKKAVSLLQESEKRGEGSFKGHVSVCVCVCVHACLLCMWVDASLSVPP